MEEARRRASASCDYTFHAGVTRFDETTTTALKAVVAEEKISSFKVFLAYKGRLRHRGYGTLSDPRACQ